MNALGFAPPDPSALAGGLADTVGNSVLDAMVAVLPAVIPVLVALWAVGFVWSKVRPVSGAARPRRGHHDDFNG